MSQQEDKKLAGKKIALIATDGFEQSELLEPRKALEKAGARVDIISLKAGEIKSWTNNNWGPSIQVDKTIKEARCEDYDALMLPGGVINADKLRNEKAVVEFVTDFIKNKKPIAAICHAPWILIETKLVKGREMTSWPSLQTDLENADAIWEDESVIVDNGWITSRKPEDIPAFNYKMVEEFSEGIHPSENVAS